MEHLIDRINWRMMEFYSGEDSRRIGIPGACMTIPGCRRRSPVWNRIGRFCMTKVIIRSTGRRDANYSTCCS
ncbi:hypothetical protein C8D82_103109 [Victivallis vadensis]|uniref:Uncharacterized protein n=1 Tax=Victivallis vadensis TaxID=172901 RepID=A0A2U1B961_9BACT|nr:hypothetical protein C8D82_103109 [Victivallis vadensis]